MKIAIDIDEVVIGFVEKYLKFAKEEGYKEVNYEDVFCYKLWDVLEIKKKEAFELMNRYDLTDYFKKIDLIKGAREGIYFLKNNFDIYFITARPDSIKKHTRDIIFNEFGILGDRVIFAGDLMMQGKKRKDDICKELGVELIIEDNGIDSLEYAKNGLRVLLLDKPWNQEFKHENIFRCFNWDDILKKVEEIKNES